MRGKGGRSGNKEEKEKIHDFYQEIFVYARRRASGGREGRREGEREQNREGGRKRMRSREEGNHRNRKRREKGETEWKEHELDKKKRRGGR